MTSLRLAAYERLALAVGLVLLVIVTVLAVTSGSSGSNHTRSPDALRLGLEAHGLCGDGDGTPLDLAAARSQVAYQIQLPHAADAAPANISRMALCGQTETVAAFPSGLRVYNDVNTFADPASDWAQAAAEDSGEASVGALADGTPALLIDPAKDPAHSALGSVTFVHGGTWVLVEGNGNLPLTALVRVASTVAEA